MCFAFQLDPTEIVEMLDIAAQGNWRCLLLPQHAVPPATVRPHVYPLPAETDENFWPDGGFRAPFPQHTTSPVDCTPQVWM